MQWTRFAYSAPAFLLQRNAPMGEWAGKGAQTSGHSIHLKMARKPGPKAARTENVLQSVSPRYTHQNDQHVVGIVWR